jgi:hypothetical protein
LAGCGATAARTQPPVVIHATTAGCAETMPGQDPYEAALAAARCEHPDMLVHPRLWVVRRVPSGPNVARFTLVQTRANTAECCYEVDASGDVRHVR